MPHDRMLATRNTYTWVHKYIFPGGFLPSTEAIEDVTRDAHRRCASPTGSPSASTTRETLRLWDERFVATPRRCARSGSTRSSAACGTSTSSTPGPASPRATSTCSSSCCDREGITDDRPRPDRVPRPSTTARVARRLATALAPVRRRRAAGPPHGVGRQRGRAADAPSVVLRSPQALRRLLWHPGELGAAQAYVTGELDVEGDLDAALTHVWRGGAERGLSGVRPAPGARSRTCCAWPRTSARSDRRRRAPASQAVLPRPAAQPRPRPRRRSTTTTTSPTTFYALILDPHMAYSCGYWRSDDPAYTVEDAQRDKLELVCRKLGLGARGCGSSTSAAAGARSACMPRSTSARRSPASPSRRAEASSSTQRIRRARSAGPGRDPAAGLPRDHRRPVRRGRVARDGRARRRSATTGTYAAGAARQRASRRPGARPADVATGPAPGRRPVHRVVHRPGHAHAPGRRDRRAHRVRRP